MEIEMKLYFSTGELFKALRLASGLNQSMFAQELAVHQATVSRIERDIFEDVPLDVAIRACNLLNISMKCFQSGYINFTSKEAMRKVNPTYVNNGEFNAKTVYFILQELCKLTDRNIFQEVRIDKTIFAFIKVKYSKILVESLYNKYPGEMEQAWINIMSTIETKIETNEQRPDFTTRISQYHGLTIEQRCELENFVVTKLDNQNHFNNDFSMKILKFYYLDLCLQLNYRLPMNTTRHSNDNGLQVELTSSVI